jgi:polysaccharide deacetylase family protein (PEP-CTERM system associated)
MTAASAVANVLSFDLEHWHTATLLRDVVTDRTDRIDESVAVVTDLLDEHDVRATFFTVGEVAREYPAVVADLAADGHEIASHGHTHTPLYELDEATFERELALSTDAIRDVTGERPIGFRAPNFSVGPRTRWAFDALDAAAFRYDSSLFPVRTPMYGVSGAPIRPYALRQVRPFVGDGDVEEVDSFLEFPLAVFNPSFRLPIAGGFYARMLPVGVLKRGIRSLNRRGIPATLYFHPWEFNPAVVTNGIAPHKRFVSFHGIERLEGKLDALLDSFVFDSVQGVIDRHGW